MRRFAAVFGTILTVTTLVAQQPASHVIVPADEIEWAAIRSLPQGATGAVLSGNPGATGALYALRLKLPDGYVLPPHWHPQDENALILSGTLLVGMGEKVDRAATKPLAAGGFFMMPAKMPHYAVAQGEVVIQLWGLGPLEINYVDPADDPRKPAKP